MPGTATISYPAPSVLNLVIERDADTTLTFVLLDALGLHPVDITNDTVKFTASDTYGGTAQIATLTKTTGQHTDPTNGKTAFAITKAIINAAASSTKESCWVYEVRRLTGGTSPEVVHIVGELRVQPSVVAT